MHFKSKNAEEKDAEGGPGRQEDYSKSREEIYGCCEGGHGVGWCERLRRPQWQQSKGENDWNIVTVSYSQVSRTDFHFVSKLQLFWKVSQTVKHANMETTIA